MILDPLRDNDIKQNVSLFLHLRGLYYNLNTFFIINDFSFLQKVTKLSQTEF